MSQNKRNQHSTQFKAKVALEAIKGEKTIAQIAHQYSIHPTTINNRTYALTGKQNCGELRLTPSTVSGCERTVKALNGSV